MQENLYLIYALIDPIDKTIRYIGKSSSGLLRPKSHSTPSSLNKEPNTRKTKWIIALLEQGLKPEIVILEFCEDNFILNEKEIEYIKKYKELGFDLYNNTIGGNGLFISDRRKPIIGVCIQTKETREYSKIHNVAKDGFSVTKVCAVCKGRKKHHKGWFFYYKDNPKEYQLVAMAKEVIIKNISTGEIKKYNDLKDASSQTKLSYKTLQNYCSNNVKNKKFEYSYGKSTIATTACPHCGDNQHNCHCNNEDFK